MKDALPGAGMDATPDRRPGVPMELEPHPIGHAHWDEPEPQPLTVPILARPELTRPTPVFGTSSPPRGVSGAIRRFAYRIPDHRPAHWLTLMLADRVDAIEHDPIRALPFALGVGAAVAMLMLRQRRSNRRFRWR